MTTVKVTKGLKPWLPTPEACNLDVWHAYDGPLVGTFTQKGRKALFVNVLGEHDGAAVWAYTYLSARDAGSLEDKLFESVEDMNTAIADLCGGQIVTFALTSDSSIRNFGDVAMDADQSLLAGALTFCRTLVEALASSGHEAQEQHVQRVELQAMARQLI